MISFHTTAAPAGLPQWQRRALYSNSYTTPEIEIANIPRWNLKQANLFPTPKQTVQQLTLFQM
jgi:hypothetical protein